jgi:hypothetical protein
MVASPEVPRNAEGTQSEGRVGGGRPSTPVQRGQQYKHYKGRDTPKDTLTLVVLIAAWLIGVGQSACRATSGWG